VSESRPSLIITPLEGYVPEIGRMLWQMDDTRLKTLKTLSEISPALIDWLPPHPRMNSIGTLLYHIADVEMGWVFFDLLRVSELPSDMKALFPYEPRDSRGKLNPITGISVEEHKARFDTVRQSIKEVFKTMTLEDFRRVRSLPDEYDVTPEWVLYHLIEHEREHHGEMMTMAVMASMAQA
jgi:uncharacterized damage-inducible protein DinB